jgi:hypothetical protein
MLQIMLGRNGALEQGRCAHSPAPKKILGCIPAFTASHFPSFDNCLPFVSVGPKYSKCLLIKSIVARLNRGKGAYGPDVRRSSSPVVAGTYSRDVAGKSQGNQG